MISREGEYYQKGDYHKELDKNWPFYPVYIEKMRLVENFLKNKGKGKKILDLGCGEGVLVEKFKSMGFDIIGIDLNYESELVSKRPIADTGLSDNSFDLVLCLDVLEHLGFEEQERAISEIRRILKPGGIMFLTLPNLAHFASRLSFFFTGKLIRTSDILRHKGDRPISEFLKMIKKADFKITNRKGLFPTYPVSALLTYYLPSRMVLWHRFLNKFLAYPNWSFLNLIVCANNKND